MAAWKHFRIWHTDKRNCRNNGPQYNDYRRYVQQHAQDYEGATEDCANLSMTLIVNYAASRGLPLTFFDNYRNVYCSKGVGGMPSAFTTLSGQVLTSMRSSYSLDIDSRSEHPPGSRWRYGVRNVRWDSIESYLYWIRRRIGSMSLRDECTEINPDWPQSGDLMVSDTHTALVFARYEPGERHPFANRADVPVFPGPEAAAAQLNQTKYFRDQAGTLVGPPRPEVRFDYLNHRGQGNPVKQKAELIYYASVSDPVFKAFTFRRYTDAVLDPWLRWTGIDNPWEATMANPFLPP